MIRLFSSRVVKLGDINTTLRLTVDEDSKLRKLEIKGANETNDKFVEIGSNYIGKPITIKDAEKIVRLWVNQKHLYSKCPDDGCIQKKPNGKWGVISGKTGKFWDADYDTEEDARAGLRAYFANRHFSLSTIDLYGDKRGKYEPIMVVFLQDGNSFTWYTQQLPRQFWGSPLSEVARSNWYNDYRFKHKNDFILLINRYHPQFKTVVKEYNDFLDRNFLIKY